METWYEYRLVWARHPWLIAVAALAVAVLGIGIVETIIGGPLVLLFIPGLILVYGHHLLIKRKSESDS